MVTLTVTGDGFKWGDPQNWVADAIPQKGDIVQIAGDSVLVSDEVTIKQLELLAGSILVQQSDNSSSILRWKRAQEKE